MTGRLDERIAQCPERVMAVWAVGKTSRRMELRLRRAMFPQEGVSGKVVIYTEEERSGLIPNSMLVPNTHETCCLS